MIDDALYYEFEFFVGERPAHGGLWHYARVIRVMPDSELEIERRAFATRWGAKRGAKRIAKEDVKWLRAHDNTEYATWRP